MQFEIKKNAALSEIKKFTDLNKIQIKALEDFVLMLLSQNDQFNFIGKSTVAEVWNRHILDSAQLLQFIENKNIKFADFGSGAGFPGLVLSILGLKEIHLIEKAFRKAEFLRQAKLFSPNRVFITQTKLEEIHNRQFDCIVSRALAPLDQLLIYCQKFLSKDGYALFLKGKNLAQEIALAKKSFQFEYELHPSLTSLESNIIKVTKISQLIS
ncbi:MAG: 16S rRNA (guanine(527)-N(7))-methyltransferase RsmG [Rickettsiales bacterium]|nr:16S rRNA (guanine(527)-N(7))-methyltransferase RsmG [Rickettsiales bacterium]